MGEKLGRKSLEIVSTGKLASKHAQTLLIEHIKVRRGNVAERGGHDENRSF